MTSSRKGKAGRSPRLGQGEGGCELPLFCRMPIQNHEEKTGAPLRAWNRRCHATRAPLAIRAMAMGTQTMRTPMARDDTAA